MSTMASQIISLTIVLLNRLFRRRSKKTSKFHVTGLCSGNSPVTGEFPAQTASDAENVSTWWRHDVVKISTEHRSNTAKQCVKWFDNCEISYGQTRFHEILV